MEETRRERVIIANVQEIRREDPGIGGYKLWIMLCALFGPGFMPGRDSFYMLLRRYRLMLPPRKARHTTNSNHRYHKWKNLVKGLAPMEANRIWVADITYIDLADGSVCYLHLITDAYSHKIVGWMLADSLRSAITMQALEQAIAQAVAMRGSDSLKGLIHHSDRGVQYCCDDYVAMLQSHDISISMTEDYNPTDNAIAERTNGIIKMERVYSQRHFPGRGACTPCHRPVHPLLQPQPPAHEHRVQGPGSGAFGAGRTKKDVEKEKRPPRRRPKRK